MKKQKADEKSFSKKEIANAKKVVKNMLKTIKKAVH